MCRCGNTAVWYCGGVVVWWCGGVIVCGLSCGVKWGGVDVVVWCVVLWWCGGVVV